MEDIHGTINLYEEMSKISTHMVDAAQYERWEELSELECRIVNLRTTLQRLGAKDLVPVDIERKRVLIQKILDDDAKIRFYTEQWMEQVRSFIGTGVQSRRVSEAYRALG